MEKVSLLFVLAEDEEHSAVTEGQNGARNLEEEPAAVVSASSSAGAHSEIDAKLADFFNVSNWSLKMFWKSNQNYCKSTL